MDHRKDIRDSLTSRRSRITPDRAGLPAYGGKRRVAGLRREEVALLAGVSVDYYTRLERGNLTGVSESVLHAVAGALQLDDAEREHLFDLARVANATPRTRRRTSAAVRPSVQRVLDAMSGAPAWVHNDRLDFLAANRLGYALYSEFFTDQVRPANSARFMFLNRGRATSILTGKRSPTTPSRFCAVRRDATPSTRSSPSSSANYPRAVWISEVGGRRTTCVCIAPA
jgi:transcriptional regulator with XRE-family HTH domain